MRSSKHTSNTIVTGIVRAFPKGAIVEQRAQIYRNGVRTLRERLDVILRHKDKL